MRLQNRFFTESYSARKKSNQKALKLIFGLFVCDTKAVLIKYFCFKMKMHNMQKKSNFSSMIAVFDGYINRVKNNYYFNSKFSLELTQHAAAVKTA